MRSRRRTALTTLLSALVAAGSLVGAAGRAGAADPAPAAITGGGVNFAATAINQWRSDVALDSGLPVGADFTSLADAETKFASGSADYLASDLAFTPDQLAALNAGRCSGIAAGSCFDYVPTSVSGVALAFNVVGKTGVSLRVLSLTRQAACKIFTGAITKWDDPEIVATNSELATVDRDIHPVVHAEPSGDSYALSQYCIAVAPQVWAAFVAQQANDGFAAQDTPAFDAGEPTSTWPAAGWGDGPVAVNSDDGVASYVADSHTGPDSIGYEPVRVAEVRRTAVAQLADVNSNFVSPYNPNLTHLTEAADGSIVPDFSAPGAYPVEVAWVVAPNQGFDPAKGATLARFLCWAVTAGQVSAARIKYQILPPPLRTIAVNAIEKIPGAPSAHDCSITGRPTVPTDIVAVAHPGSAAVFWTPSRGGLYGIFSYVVTASPGGRNVEVNHRSAIIEGLQPGVTYTFRVAATNEVGASASSDASNAVTPTKPISGYWMLGANGTVYSFGSAEHFGNAPGPAVALVARADGTGYWVVDRQGVVTGFGAAHAIGTPPVLAAGEIVSSISDTPSGNGYWLFTDRGRVFPYGDAAFFGDMSKTTLNGPVVASVATPTGHGYYIVGSDGGVFTFGDATFRGSTGGFHLNQPVVGMAPTPDNRGYWLVAADGGVFAFDALFQGSMGGVSLNKSVNGLVPFGNGYLMVASDGGVFDFSNKNFEGSLAENPPAAPIIGIAAFTA